MLKTIKKYIQDVLLQLRDVLEPATVKAVSEYLAHAEYELAFEGLMLDIMNLPTVPILDYMLAWEYAIALGLDIESTFDDAFGGRFLAFVSTNGEKAVPSIPKV